MLEEIESIIAKNLPMHIGEQLQKRLSLCAELEKKLPVITKERNDWKEAADELRRRNEEWAILSKTLDSREANVTRREAEVAKKELAAALVHLREEHAAQRVNDAKEIVLAVFANSKFKYTECGNISGPNGYQSTSKNIDTVQ